MLVRVLEIASCVQPTVVRTAHSIRKFAFICAQNMRCRRIVAFMDFRCGFQVPCFECEIHNSALTAFPRRLY